MSSVETSHADEMRRVLAAVRRVELHAEWLVDSALAGGYRSAFRGSGIEFEEVREYVPGDDPRAIDWNVTARVGRPFVKKYVDERELTLRFVVDVSRSMRGGVGSHSLREVAAIACATIAFTAERNGDKLELMTFAHDVVDVVPAGRGRRHALRLVRGCLPTDRAIGTTRIDVAVDAARRAWRSRSVVFLVSDFLGDVDWREALTRLAREHEVVAIRVRDRAWHRELRGLLRMRDSESGAERLIDWSNRRDRAHFERSVAAHDLSVEDAFAAAGVVWLDVTSPEPGDPDGIARALRTLFDRRAGRVSR